MDTPLSLPKVEDLLNVQELSSNDTLMEPIGYANMSDQYDTILPALLNLNGVLHQKAFKETIYLKDETPMAQQKYQLDLEKFKSLQDGWNAGTAVGPPPQYPQMPTIEKEIEGTQVIMFPGVKVQITMPFNEFKETYLEFIKRKQLSL